MQKHNSKTATISTVCGLFVKSVRCPLNRGFLKIKKLAKYNNFSVCISLIAVQLNRGFTDFIVDDHIKRTIISSAKMYMKPQY